MKIKQTKCSSNSMKSHQSKVKYLSYNLCLPVFEFEFDEFLNSFKTMLLKFITKMASKPPSQKRQ